MGPILCGIDADKKMIQIAKKINPKNKKINLSLEIT